MHRFPTLPLHLHLKQKNDQTTTHAQAQRNLSSPLERRSLHLDNIILMVLLRDLLLDLVEVDMGGCVVAVEDLADLLEGWAIGFDVEEVDEDKFAGVPKL